MLIIGISFLRRNNMKKKLFVLFLAFAMVFAFAACGGGGGSDSGSDEGTGSVYWLNYKKQMKHFRDLLQLIPKRQAFLARS